MTPEATGQAYDQITHLWQSSDFDTTNGIEALEKALAYTAKPGKALDVGCGSEGRFLQYLRERLWSLEGIDVSSQSIDIISGKYPEISFIKGDFLKHQFSNQYDFIVAWDSLWHLPLESQMTAMSKMASLLKPSGVYLFSFGGVKDAEEHFDTTMGPQVSYSTLGCQGFINSIYQNDLRLLHFEFDQGPKSQHAYCIAQKE